MSESFRDLLRLDGARPTQLPTDTTPGFDKKKKKGLEAIEEVQPDLAELQERLYAAARGRSNASVLLVLQGMDTSGKGGVIEHVTGLVNPQGLSITSFKEPTEEERAHDFLWRIRRALPEPGQIGVFDRSHYEDVLVVRVHELAPRSTWASRYESINNFERDLTEQGVHLVKCFLHISPETQRERLLARLDDPTKYWKYNPGDVDERGYWAHYAAAYDDAVTKCHTDHAPWYVVPSDRKWYRNLAISMLLLETLREIDPQWPPADFDVEVERARLSRATLNGSSKNGSGKRKGKGSTSRAARGSRMLTDSRRRRK